MMRRAVFPEEPGEMWLTAVRQWRLPLENRVLDADEVSCVFQAGTKNTLSHLAPGAVRW